MENKLETRLIKDEKEAEGVENAIVIDVDKGVQLLINFNRKAVSKAKPFKKLAKKFDGANPTLQKKKTLKFMKDELYPLFKTEFLDKFYPHKEYEVLDKDIIATYIFGSFVQANATTTKIDIPTQFALIVSELSNRIYSEIEKRRSEF